MKRLLRRCSIAVSTLLLLGLAIQTTSAQDFSGKVVGIKDGDTIEVMRGGRAVTVRLHGIDTPERGQPFGTRARQHTSDLAFSNVVTVRHRDTDRYGRTVGEVILPDGSSLNAALVRDGLAWWYRQYAPGDLELAALEEDARSSRRGLWADAEPVAPWDWRRAASPRRGAQAADDKDCSDFATYEEALTFFQAAGPGDPHRLDGDGDGSPCESLSRASSGGQTAAPSRVGSSSSIRSASVRCSATTQKGARCKRMTKNASGRCWQHQ